MATPLPPQKPESVFGIIQGFLLGTLLLAGILIAVPFYSIPSGTGSLANAFNQRLSTSAYPWIGAATWGLEIALYFALAYVYSKRLPLVACGGIFFGIIFRLVENLLTASVLSARLGVPVITLVAEVNSEVTVLRVLGIFITAAVLAFPCRHLLAVGFGFRLPQSPSVPNASGKQFSFSSPHRMAGTRASMQASAGHLGESVHALQPPEDFSPVVPQEGVVGVVNVPVEVILASVPEAQNVVSPQLPVRIRLAYIVPQLSRATVWLTWQQVFLSSPDDPNRQHGPRQDEQFAGRWIRIAAKYYVSQIPREYFTRTKPAPFRWMIRPAVPQEDQLEVS